MLNKQQGSLLIELMIAITISLLILGGLFEMEMIIERNTELQVTLHALENSANVAAEILSNELVKAGHIGCPKLSDNFPFYAEAKQTININNPLTATDDYSFVVKYMDYPTAILTTSMNDLNSITVNQVQSFAAGDWVIIADCQKAELFQLASVYVHNGAQVLIPINPLHELYAIGSEVGVFVQHTFKVMQTDRKNPRGEIIRALFVEDEKKHRVELVDGVDQLKFTYTLNDHGKWVEKLAGDIIDWSQVKGVNIQMTVSSMSIKKVMYAYVALH